MSFSLHPGAESDIADALDFYLEHAGLSVAQRFLDAFEQGANILTRYPGLGTPTTRGRRTYPLKVFPYSIVYRALDGDIHILIVRHQHRKPGFADRRK